jgi:DNA-binding MurR/RpiR family transcriptional regulator
MSIQSTIQSVSPALPPAMRRVADAILARPQVLMELTISELARACNTSETSVVRFCREVGLSGYAQLKLQMASELGKEAAQFSTGGDYGSDIRPGDTLAEAVAKVASSEIVGIQETAANLDMAALGKIVEIIDNARTVLLYGVSASGAGAQDLQQKLLRIGKIALTFRDSHDALVSANLLKPGDVAVVFSHSGTTKESVELLRAARHSGATTVAISNVAGSAVTAEADYILLTAVRETTFRSGAMASRIAQLTVVDYIFVGVAQRSYQSTVQALRTTYDALRVLRDDR